MMELLSNAFLSDFISSKFLDNKNISTYQVYTMSLVEFQKKETLFFLKMRHE